MWSVLLVFVMPFVYILLVVVMFTVAKWLAILFGVISGDKSVIHEFNCHEKKDESWSALFEELLIGRDNRNLPPRDNWRGPNDWRQ